MPGLLLWLIATSGLSKEIGTEIKDEIMDSLTDDESVELMTQIPQFWEPWARMCIPEMGAVDVEKLRTLQKDFEKRKVSRAP